MPEKAFPDFRVSGQPDVRSMRRALVRAFPDLRIVERTRFKMAAHLVHSLLDGRKRTTVRYERGAVEIPVATTMPLLRVGARAGAAEGDLSLRVTRVRYMRLGDLGHDDAVADGFASRGELLDALAGFYGPISPGEVVCVYSVEPEGLAVPGTKSLRAFEAQL